MCTRFVCTCEASVGCACTGVCVYVCALARVHVSVLCT